MEHPEFHVELVSFASHQPELRARRDPVFLLEQAVAPELEWDDLDDVSVHVLARDHEGQPSRTDGLTLVYRGYETVGSSPSMYYRKGLESPKPCSARLKVTR